MLYVFDGSRRFRVKCGVRRFWWCTTLSDNKRCSRGGCQWRGILEFRSEMQLLATTLLSFVDEIIAMISVSFRLTLMRQQMEFDAGCDWRWQWCLVPGKCSDLYLTNNIFRVFRPKGQPWHANIDPENGVACASTAVGWIVMQANAINILPMLNLILSRWFTLLSKMAAFYPTKY